MISGFSGSYRTDHEARAVYAEAAGIGRVLPWAVAVPRTVEDVRALVRWARETQTPLIPRGSGSSMGGGAIGTGVIVDISRLDHVWPIDTARKRIRVGPGAIRDRVDHVARDIGLRFPPDPSSGAFCTIGGMISTNAAGSHTLKFGATREWIHAIDCVFDDGSHATLRRGDAAWPAGIPALDRLRAVADDLRRRGAAHAAEHVGVKKESSGYAVHAFAEHGDPIDLIIGSEGTLAFIVGAELRLAPVPGATSSVLGTFATLDDAVAAAIAARDAGAAACELLDRTYLDIASAHAELPQIPNGTEAVLLAEVEGDSTENAAERARALAEAFQAARASTVSLALTPVDEVAVWELRHAASPTLASLGPTMRSMQFIEDGAVPPERFAEYVRGIREILDRHSVPGVIFGHAGDAHAHVNPLIDTSMPWWQEQVASVLSETVELTARLGGTLTAEHGDGRLRTPLLSHVWSNEAIELFAMVKHAFDPAGIFNPGVKVPLSDQTPLGDIKYDPTLAPLPPSAASVLDVIARNRAYSTFRLDLLDSAS